MMHICTIKNTQATRVKAHLKILPWAPWRRCSFSPILQWRTVSGLPSHRVSWRGGVFPACHAHFVPAAGRRRSLLLPERSERRYIEDWCTVEDRKLCERPCKTSTVRSVNDYVLQTCQTFGRICLKLHCHCTSDVSHDWPVEACRTLLCLLFKTMSYWIIIRHQILTLSVIIIFKGSVCFYFQITNVRKFWRSVQKNPDTKFLDSTCSSSGSQLSSSRTSEGTAGFRGLVCGEAGMQPSAYGYPRDESGEPEYWSGCSAFMDLPGTDGVVYWYWAGKEP